MKYLIVAPTEREYSNITLSLEGRTLQNSYSVVRTGVGKALAAANTALAINRADGEVDRVAIVGYAASTIGR